MDFVLKQLQKNKDVFHDLLKDIDEPMLFWKQSPDKWCLLEIVCHLYDEEREDFRFRTQWVLENPNKIPPPFNPVVWVSERKYIEQHYNEMLNNFLEERAKSIAWLKTLKAPNWEHSFEHPKLGTLTAKHFYNNWLAHDYLHLRQIIKLKFDYLKHVSGEDLSYAGAW